MKRLLTQIGITYFSVLAAAFYLPESVVTALACAALAAAAVLLLIRKTRKTIYIPLMALTVVIACVVHLCYGFIAVRPLISAYGDEDHSVKAVLTEEAYQSYSKYYYRLKTISIDDRDVSTKLLLKTEKPIDADPDDTLSFTAVLRATDNRYYRAKGYYLLSDEIGTGIVTASSETHSLYYHAIRLRQKMRKTLDRYLPENGAALCKAVLVGDRYAMSAEVKDHFRYAGASYFIVVSGMHFTVLCMLMLYVLRLFGRLRLFNRWVRFVMLLLFMLFYAAVTGFQSSVVRAGIMTFFTVLGLTLRRQAYPLNHLGAAGLVIPFIVTPYGAGDVGLILSFYATMGILLWAAPIAQKLCCKDEYGNILQLHPIAFVRQRAEAVLAGIRKEKDANSQKTGFSLPLLFKKLYNAFALILSVSLAANIMVFPLTVFLFHEFSAVTLLSAVLLYWAIYLILILSFLLCLFSWWRFAAMLIACPLTGLCSFVLWIVKGLSSLPFAFCRISSPFVFVWLALTITLGLVVLLYRNRYRYLKAAALCSLTILLGGSLIHGLLQSRQFSLEVYDSGAGICAGINKGGRLYLLSMDGNTQNLYPIWNKLTYRYGAAEFALCCKESENRNYLLYRDDEFAISTLLLYDSDGRYTDEIDAVTFQESNTFLLDDEITVTVSVNEGVVIPYITAGEKRLLIVPRDCQIDDIPESMRSADVILLSRAIEGMQRLRCEDMIISGNDDLAIRTALALKECYHHVYFTDQGDVYYRLR